MYNIINLLEIHNLKTGIQFPTKENKHIILDLRLFDTPLHFVQAAHLVILMK